MGEKARLKQEGLDAKKTVDEFLKQKRFKGITVLRKGICGVPTLPLHTAIEDGEVELVQALLRCGADPEQKASGKSTLQQEGLARSRGYCTQGWHGRGPRRSIDRFRHLSRLSSSFFVTAFRLLFVGVAGESLYFRM